MKQPEVFKKIGGIIQELNEQYEYLQSASEHLNDLELELFVANTLFLRDHAEILRKLNLIKLQAGDERLQNKTAAENTAQEPKYFEPVVQQKPVERTLFKPEPAKPAADEIRFDLFPPADDTPAPQIDLHTGSRADSYSYEREEPEIIRHQFIPDETTNRDGNISDLPGNNAAQRDSRITEQQAPRPDPEPITEAEAPVSTNPEPVIGNHPKTQASPEAAQPDKVLSLNQKIAAQLRENKPANGPASLPPVHDMKAAINLNDKLLFIKDLFNGYALSYSEAVEILNRFKSLDEADRFLKTNYVIKNNWEGKKATADKFYALLKRRYA